MMRVIYPVFMSLALLGTSEAEDEKLVLAHYMTDMVPRTDRLTYSYSSAFDREFARLFGAEN
jgi:hypothetical protein